MARLAEPLATVINLSFTLNSFTCSSVLSPVTIKFPPTVTSAVVDKFSAVISPVTANAEPSNVKFSSAFN